MKSMRVSPKFQVVIPKEVRQRMRLRPGMRFKVVEGERRIELVPIGRKRDAWSSKGMVRAMRLAAKKYGLRMPPGGVVRTTTRGETPGGEEP